MRCLVVRNINVIQCGSCLNVTTKVQVNLDLRLEICKCNTLLGALGNYFGSEVLDGENMFFCCMCSQKVVALKLPWYFVQASSLTQIVYPSCTTLHLMMIQQAGLVQPPFLPRRHLLHPNPISSLPSADPHPTESLSPPSLHHTQQRSPPWTLGSLDISTMGN